MPTPIACPACSARLTLPDSLPAKIKVLRCPQCKEGIPVSAAQALKTLLAGTPEPSAAATTTRVEGPKTKTEVKKTEPPKPAPSADSLLPDLDDVGLAGEEAPAPQPKAPTRSEAPKVDSPPSAPASSFDSFLPDLDGVGLLDDPAPPPNAAAPSKPSAPSPPLATSRSQPNELLPDFEEVKLSDEEDIPEIPNLQIEDDFELVSVESHEEEEIVSVEAAHEEEIVSVEAAHEEEIVSVEAADDDIVSVEAADERFTAVEPGDLANLVMVEGVDGGDDDLVAVEAAVEEEEFVEVEDGAELVHLENEKPRLKGLLGHSEYVLKAKAFTLINLKYNILESNSGKKLGTANEETGAGSHVASMFISRRFVSNEVVIRDNRERVLCSIKRPPFLFKSRMEVLNADGDPLGFLEPRFLHFMGMNVYDWKDRHIVELKGKLRPIPAFHFHTPKGKRLGSITLEAWAKKKITFSMLGLSWFIKLKEEVDEDEDRKMLLLATAIGFDMARIATQK